MHEYVIHTIQCSKCDRVSSLVISAEELRTLRTELITGPDDIDRLFPDWPEWKKRQIKTGTHRDCQSKPLTSLSMNGRL